MTSKLPIDDLELDVPLAPFEPTPLDGSVLAYMESLSETGLSSVEAASIPTVPELLAPPLKWTDMVPLYEEVPSAPVPVAAKYASPKPPYPAATVAIAETSLQRDVADLKAELKVFEERLQRVEAEKSVAGSAVFDLEE